MPSLRFSESILIIWKKKKGNERVKMLENLIRKKKKESAHKGTKETMIPMGNNHRLTTY